LTEEGRKSPLFAELPLQFTAIESHRDAVSELPSNAILLAGNEHTPVQAIKWGKDVYGVQFHPEFTRSILLLLWRERREQWRGKLGFDLDAVLDSTRDTPHCLQIFRNFIQSITQP
ncbi:MAG: hypothetical protein WCQ57_15205, partial [Verrucomicrobiota bacterium]